MIITEPPQPQTQTRLLSSPRWSSSVPLERDEPVKQKTQSPSEGDPRILNGIRLAIVAFFWSIYQFPGFYQPVVDAVYSTLYNWGPFHWQMYDTLIRGALWWIFLGVWLISEKAFNLLPYKMHNLVRYAVPTISEVYNGSKLYDGVVWYIIPLCIMDAFIPKSYPGVTNSYQFIHLHRTLPAEPPAVTEYVYHLFLSMVVYDTCFFWIHYMQHKVKFLYKYTHAEHHTHPAGMNAITTNQLDLLERIFLVQVSEWVGIALGTHPLTRISFAAILLFGLMENHVGNDLPYSYEKIVPFGIMGGSRHHVQHHLKINSNYALFFTHWDYIMKSHLELK